MKELDYRSQYAPYIRGLIAMKKQSGFCYDYEAIMLEDFDHFCINHQFTEAVLTKEIVDLWSAHRRTESIGYQSQRITIVRQLSLYMSALGLECYVPGNFCRCQRNVPHVLSPNEIAQLFQKIDSYRIDNVSLSEYRYFEAEYKVLFRMIYCCGLRNAEAAELQRKNIDLDGGIIHVIHSKGDKNRDVVMAPDLAELCREYWMVIAEFLGFEPEWFFPGKDPSKHILKTSVDRKFNEFWRQTDCAAQVDKKPTVHCLRHTFVVNRMDDWMEKDYNLNNLMPYLAAYLGHKDSSGSFYYYHTVKRSFDIVRRKDTVSAQVIPEVASDEI